MYDDPSPSLVRADHFAATRLLALDAAAGRVYNFNNYTKVFVVLWNKRGLYTQEMALPIPAVQQALKEDGLDGWLLYDFHGSNPIATRLADLAHPGSWRRAAWYYLVPATGDAPGTGARDRASQS